MGIDPINPNYDPGDECSVCVDEIFNGITPEFVEAHIDGVVNCPGAPIQFDDGVYLLTQLVPCVWQVILPNTIRIRWSLNVGNSSFQVGQAPFLWFSHLFAAECATEYANANVCGVGFGVGSGGTAEIFWGPTINPGP